MLTALAIAVLSAGSTAQEKTKVPKDSIELVVVGCLKDRFLTTTRAPRMAEGDELDVSPDRFQISGKKAILDEVKKHDRAEVEIVGLVRKADLKEPGIPVAGGRVVVTPGRPGDRYSPIPPADRVVLLQASSVKPLEGACPR